MPEPIFSLHARDMLKERDIPEEWVLRTIKAPEEKGVGATATCIITNHCRNVRIGSYMLSLMKRSSPIVLSPCFWTDEGE